MTLDYPHREVLSRRGFLRASAISGAALTIGSPGIQAFAQAASVPKGTLPFSGDTERMNGRERSPCVS